MAGTEAAIRSILRFLYNDMKTVLAIPSEGYQAHSFGDLDQVPIVSTDVGVSLVVLFLLREHW